MVQVLGNGIQGNQIVLQQAQQPQIIQTADGQTLLYQQPQVSFATNCEKVDPVEFEMIMNCVLRLSRQTAAETAPRSSSPQYKRFRRTGR